MKSTLAITAIVFTIGFVSLPVVFSDTDFDWEEYQHRAKGVANVSNPLYTEECGSCHMAYPPGLLPGASWQHMMTSLDDHFGDNAELAAQTRREITGFLVAHGADRSDYRRSRKFLRAIDTNNAPLRITETPYFKHQHDEIPPRLVQDNPDVSSFSQCNSCHDKAVQGSFDDDNVRIPGFGRWDD